MKLTHWQNIKLWCAVHRDNLDVVIGSCIFGFIYFMVLRSRIDWLVIPVGLIVTLAPIYAAYDLYRTRKKRQK